MPLKSNITPAQFSLGALRFRAITAAAAVSALTFAFCPEYQASEEWTPGTESVEIDIPGLEEEATILWISDMHIFSYPDDDEIVPEKQAGLEERRSIFENADGIPSSELWETISGRVDSFDADYIVFGGDMIDYMSSANLDVLGAGLEKIKTPWMYIRADHDYGRWYVDMGLKKMRKLHSAVAPRNKLWVQDFGDFILAGLDNTTSAISEETLKQFEDICSLGSPVILCTHVPIDQSLEEKNADGSLAALSEENWGDRVLCWGSGDFYDTDKSNTMKALTDIIYAEGSPVKAVLAGHLHETWEGLLSDGCLEHLFSPAFNDHIGVITVKPQGSD